MYIESNRDDDRELKLCYNVIYVCYNFIDRFNSKERAEFNFVCTTFFIHSYVHTLSFIIPATSLCRSLLSRGKIIPSPCLVHFTSKHETEYTRHTVHWFGIWTPSIHRIMRFHQSVSFDLCFKLWELWHYCVCQVGLYVFWNWTSVLRSVLFIMA